MDLLTLYRFSNVIGWFLAGVFLRMYLDEKGK